MIYLFLFLIITLYSFYELNTESNFKIGVNAFYYFLAFLLVILAGTRLDIGFDYDTYKKIYEGVNLTNFVSYTIEFGFAFIVYVSKVFNLSFNVFLLFSAAISILLKLEFFRKNSLLIGFALLNYFCIGYLINEMGQIRHGIAIAVVLFGLKDLMDRKPYLFIVKCILASLFHTSALLVIPVVILYYLKNLKPEYLLLSLLIFLPFALVDLRSFIFSLTNYLPFFQVQAKITFYVYSDEFGGQLGFNISLLLRLIILGLMFGFYKRGTENIGGYDMLYKLYYYGIVLYLIFNSIAEFAVRSSTYFRTLDSIILPFFIILGKNRFQKNVIAMLCVLYFAYSLYKLVYSEFGGVFEPYNSFLFNYLYN